uniref:Uncharacterized protein n=1 Tax=Timema douglasi TaxID=61478 RepID=A0A7R8VEX6_TIMDO|nr:unnamed protein product [Timema douglasi]
MRGGQAERALDPGDRVVNKTHNLHKFNKRDLQDSICALLDDCSEQNMATEITIFRAVELKTTSALANYATEVGIRTSISPSSAVELNTTSALANYATEAGTDRCKDGKGTDSCRDGKGTDSCRDGKGTDRIVETGKGQTVVETGKEQTVVETGKETDSCRDGKGTDSCRDGKGTDRCKDGKGTDSCGSVTIRHIAGPRLQDGPFALVTAVPSLLPSLFPAHPTYLLMNTGEGGSFCKLDRDSKIYHSFTDSPVYCKTEVSGRLTTDVGAPKLGFRRGFLCDVVVSLTPDPSWLPVVFGVEILRRSSSSGRENARGAGMVCWDNFPRHLGVSRQHQFTVMRVKRANHSTNRSSDLHSQTMQDLQGMGVDEALPEKHPKEVTMYRFSTRRHRYVVELEVNDVLQACT